MKNNLQIRKAIRLVESITGKKVVLRESSLDNARKEIKSIAEPTTYKVTSYHSIYLDDYEEGELGHVNDYEISDTITANNPREAIKKYFEDILYFDYDEKNAEFEDRLCYYSVIVDKGNIEASKSEIEQWKKGSKTLYVDRIVISVSRVVGEDL